jgi:GTP-binding protein EngB required for normal cell division
MGDNEEFHLPVYRGSTLLDDTPTLDPKGGLEPAMRSTTDVAAGLDKAMSELLSERQSENLQLVNDLRQRGIRNFVALPEIIVCGKQSCGKSSVLEAISHVSFPRADKHCTTFPTEITINDPREQGVWICWANPIPRGVETRTLIELESEEKSLENLEGVIEKAKDTMRKQRGQECEVQFYNDVLEIKVARKGWPSFTMVDLPGIFENSHNGGRESDVGLVQNMVKSYMQRSETVILAVVEAIDNAQNQKILSMAKEYDKEGSRTLGIITKADRLDQGSGSEQDWVIHASNGHETYRFDEGWHVVRNRDFKEQVWSFEKRDKEEEDYFNSNNSWADLVKENQTGVSNLRKKLADILEKRIANSLPGIAMSLEDHLRDRQQLLKCLGISRATELGQENYLHGISTEFCRLIEEAVTANYTAKRSFFKLPENKLRTVVREKLDEFAIKMNDYGSAFQVDKTNNGPQEGLKLEYIKPEDYLGKIDQILRENRGLVLEGAFDPMILNTLFQNASVNWRYISVKSIETILVYVNRVLDRAVDAVASDKQTSQKIKAMIIQPGMVKLENTLNAKLDEILYACEELPIFTQDPEYAERLSKHRGLNNDTQNSRYYATNVIDIKAMVDIYYRVGD